MVIFDPKKKKEPPPHGRAWAKPESWSSLLKGCWVGSPYARVGKERPHGADMPIAGVLRLVPGKQTVSMPYDA